MLVDLEQIPATAQIVVSKIEWLQLQHAAESAVHIVTGTAGNLMSLKPSLPSIGRILDVEDQVTSLFEAAQLQIEIVCLLMLSAAALLALASGVVFGDRSEPTKVAIELIDGDIFRSELSDLATEAYDQGLSMSEISEIGKRSSGRYARAREAAAAEEAARASIFGEAPKILSRPISVGLWVELALCIVIDAGGDASLFLPEPWGEASDLISASITAGAIDLLFNWKAMATFAFWEEILPFTDVIPSATITWIILILGLRPWLRARRGLPPRGSKASSPIADRQSYMPVEPYMRTGECPWEE